MVPDIDNTFTCQHDATQVIQGFDASNLEYFFELIKKGTTVDLLTDATKFQKSKNQIKIYANFLQEKLEYQIKCTAIFEGASKYTGEVASIFHTDAEQNTKVKFDVTGTVKGVAMSSDTELTFAVDIPDD